MAGWKSHVNFINLHYAWIILMGILGLIVIYPYGNVKAVDAYFFGASASTESGLNTVDVKELKTYQQLYLYFIPIITNLGFINIVVVAVRLYWFEKHIKKTAPSIVSPTRGTHHAQGSNNEDVEAQAADEGEDPAPVARTTTTTTITFAPDVHPGPSGETKTLVIPSPRERDNGRPIVEREHGDSDDEDEKEIKPAPPANSNEIRRRRGSTNSGPSMSTALSIERAAASLFVLGPDGNRQPRQAPAPRSSPASAKRMPFLSQQVTIGRNSSFKHLTARDRELLGGIEYRALKLLLKIIIGYFFGLHLLGVISLVPWIHTAPQKYIDWLNECGQDKTWWAFYSAQTMVDNLGFTLTPDSMAHFKDATWPMLIMTFLAFAGNTCYPVVLRLIIWTMSKIVPRGSSTRETLQFLLDHPRRCYTLLFPSNITWILFGVLFALNFIDVLLIIVLDLDNPVVNDLPMGPRILSALFQAASARHTGTSTLALADVSPAVQFSLLVMMYIAILPIAISIRASNIYEEKTLGVYQREEDVDENHSRTYVMTHVRNQLSFDLWYIFLGTFCICIAEADKIMDNSEPAYSVFSAMFEVVSGYGNVGLSLGHPDVATSLVGQWTTFSKLVICTMMIRGRHRGLPYTLDRSIMLPTERVGEDSTDSNSKSE